LYAINYLWVLSIFSCIPIDKSYQINLIQDLLRELEEFAFKGIPDLSQARPASRPAQCDDMVSVFFVFLICMLCAVL